MNEERMNEIHDIIIEVYHRSVSADEGFDIIEGIIYDIVAYERRMVE